MAKAKCCDRCGKYYRCEGEKFPSLVPREYSIRKTVRDIMNDGSPLDLCDDCYYEFLTYMKKCAYIPLSIEEIDSLSSK